MNKKTKLASLLLTLLLCGQAAHPRQTAGQPADPLRELDAQVEQLMREWEVPGLAVAVVKDDRLVFAKGYGVREAGKAERVDGRTLFGVGSATKSFTAASVAMLADAGKLQWDDPVVKHLEDFRLFDPQLTRDVTLRDLLAHRTGLPRANGSLLSPYGRAEIVRRMRHVKPSAPLRAQFTYQNQMYLVAGMAVEKVAGVTWDEFVRARIFAPLGMTASNTSVNSLKGRANVATPHAKIRGATRTLPYRSIDNYAPAGSVNSNAEELARWLRLQLGRGTYEGRQLVSPAAVRQMHAMQTVIPVGPLTEKLFPSTHFQGYGMGWFVRDYRGRKVVEHGGNVDGMSAQLGMLPEEGLGVVVLSNMDSTPLPTVLMYRIFDAYLGGRGADLNAELLKLSKEGEQQKAAQAKALEEKRTAGTKPSLPLGEYAGTYSNELYGAARVVEEDGKLVLRFSPGVEGELEHWQEETFRVNWSNPFYVEAVGKTQITFVVGAGGKVEELKAQGLADFKREGGPPARTP